MDYGQILSRSWKITWENKYLWVLGFLAALTRISSNANTNYSTSDPVTDFQSFERVMQASMAVLLLCCVFFIVGLALWLLSVVAKGGLITAVAGIDNGEEMSLGAAFRAGTARVWTLVGMNILLYLPIILAVFVALIVGFMALAGSGITFATLAEEPAVAGDALAAGFSLFFICLCGLMCGLVLVGIVLQFINAFAYRGIMLRGLGVMESISHGWQVFRANMGEVLLLAVLFFIIGIAYIFLAAMVLFPLTLVIFVPMIGMMMDGGSLGVVEVTVFVLGGLCLGLVGAALTSILATWQSAAFTLAYQEWTGKSKIVA